MNINDIISLPEDEIEMLKEVEEEKGDWTERYNSLLQRLNNENILEATEDVDIEEIRYLLYEMISATEHLKPLIAVLRKVK